MYSAVPGGGVGLAPLYQWRVGFLFPLYVLIIVVIIIQVAACTVEFSYVYMLYLVNATCFSRYAGVAVPQVLQQLREFDAPAMQSCKPLPCGTGSCQNRRLREQTLNRKPCHCGSIKGG